MVVLCPVGVTYIPQQSICAIMYFASKHNVFVFCPMAVTSIQQQCILLCQTNRQSDSHLRYSYTLKHFQKQGSMWPRRKIPCWKFVCWNVFSVVVQNLATALKLWHQLMHLRTFRRQVFVVQSAGNHKYRYRYKYKMDAYEDFVIYITSVHCSECREIKTAIKATLRNLHSWSLKSKTNWV